MFRVGLAPAFFNLGETHRLVAVARRLRELGCEVVFFSHGGCYEWLAARSGFSVVRLDPIYPDELVELAMELEKSPNPAFLLVNLFRLWRRAPKLEKLVVESIEGEIEALRSHGVDCVVVASALTMVIAARSLRLPVFSVVPGTMVPAYFEQGLGGWPDQLMNPLVALLPKRARDKLFQLLVLHLLPRTGLHTLNKLARRFNARPFRSVFEAYLGDIPLVADTPEYLGVKPTPELPAENFVGPFPPPRPPDSPGDPIQDAILNHLREDFSVLVSMGSSGRPELVLGAALQLARRGYNVVAVCTSIIPLREPVVRLDKLLLARWVPDIMEAYGAAGILVIHGGENTVHAAAYSGRPVVGVPMQAEQQYNLEALVRHGVGVMLPLRRLTPEKLAEAVERVAANYTRYLKAAKKLAARMPPPEGDKNAAKRILEILGKENPGRTPFRA